ncbi:uncharacterized protein LOC135951352 [Calliphora vicina]|uniref:uncharacterized protein LOC135951352 n=1 Tax=Calliphora vicina TaxID=7373 RepID=UPI00325C1A05
MAAYKILAIFMVLFLVQSSLAKPLDDSSNLFDSSEEEIRKNPTAAQKLLLFAIDNFLAIGKQYSANAVNVSRNILQDESMVANDKPEVLEFKKNLTMFVEKYEANKKPLQWWDIIEIYTDTTDKYSHIPEEKVTPESTFIVEILKKYNSDKMALEIAPKFKIFIDDFEKMFEENKAELDKDMLEWYEKYSHFTDMEQKIDAFSGFIDMA